MKPHKWCKEIHAFADGVEIEEQHGLWLIKAWVLSKNPQWNNPGYSFRVKDPYRELKEAAADPTKEIRLCSSEFGWSNWLPGYRFAFTELPECYEIRDKPKVKMWQWVVQRLNGSVYLTNEFFEKTPTDFATAKPMFPAPWTEIEVEQCK